MSELLRLQNVRLRFLYRQYTDFLYFDLYLNIAYAAHCVYFTMRKGRSRLRDDGNGKMSGFFGGGNFKRKMTCRLKLGVHVIATVATIAKKELSDETVRSAIATIAIATITEIENVLSQRLRQS